MKFLLLIFLIFEVKSLFIRSLPYAKSKLCLSSTDVEDDIQFEQVKINYLRNKFQDCRNDDCRIDCTRDEVKSLLRSIFPPTSPKEFEDEIKNIMKQLPSSPTVDIDDFLSVAVKNTFWEDAGELVVRELIYLDCLHSYHFEKRRVLEDEDYNKLKDDLTWAGSAAITMSSKEAHFVTAVAAYRRNQSILNDEEYSQLKVNISSF
jgi:hypothetical protein